MARMLDTIVVGGGAAGLQAALVLGRARRRTLLVDAGAPSNAPAPGIGGLLGFDRRPPAELYRAGRAEIAAYPTVELRAGEVLDGRRTGDGFELDLADGARERARTVVLATGAAYLPRQVPGVAERWGRSVFHCPFCHGWEHRDQPLGVLDRDASAVHRARLLRAWSDDVVVLTDGSGVLDGAALAALRADGFEVDERPVGGLVGAAPDLEAVAFANGGTRPVRGLLVATTMRQRSDLAARLGADHAPAGPVAEEAVVVDARFATSVPGLFAVGDAVTQRPAIAGAIEGGSTAAAMVVAYLLVEPGPGAAAGGSMAEAAAPGTPSRAA